MDFIAIVIYVIIAIIICIAVFIFGVLYGKHLYPKDLINNYDFGDIIIDMSSAESDTFSIDFSKNPKEMFNLDFVLLNVKIRE